MFVTRKFIVGAALLLAGTLSAEAADLYGNRGLRDTFAPATYSSPANWYIRGDYSYSWMDAGDLAMPSFAFGGHSIDNTWSAGGGIGKYFGRGVRGDVTYEWRGTTDVHGSAPATDFDLKGSLLLANLYYDFLPGQRFTPYIGVGVGAVHHRTGGGDFALTCAVTCTYEGGKNWSAAGAFMAGFSFRIDRGGHAPVSIKDDGAGMVEQGRMHLDVGYRFLYLGDVDTGNLVGVVNPTPGPRLDDVTAHEIRVGVRWDLR